MMALFVETSCYIRPKYKGKLLRFIMVYKTQGIVKNYPYTVLYGILTGDFIITLKNANVEHQCKLTISAIWWTTVWWTTAKNCELCGSMVNNYSAKKMTQNGSVWEERYGFMRFLPRKKLRELWKHFQSFFFVFYFHAFRS